LNSLIVLWQEFERNCSDSFKLYFSGMICRYFKLLIIYLTLIINWQCDRTDSATVKDIDGNIYKTALFADYWWMTENLKTTRYNDGSSISCIKDQPVWFRLDSAAYCYYQNDENYLDTYGLMYNWYAVNSGKLCPAGWRVPTDDEWKQLEGFSDTKFGIGDSIWNKMGLRGFDAGQRLKSAKGWREGVNGTDNIGFSALPGGERLSRFYAGGSSGFWWTGTEASLSSAYYRNLIYSYELVARDTHPKRMGFSVRCIKNR
jgi:uncharacterized protein (TIGR02145 family)